MTDEVQKFVDSELERVVATLTRIDPSGERFARVFRSTFDQLYDGQRTGRYKWEQLFKTEKTHFGTLIEINLQREFEFDDGEILDFRIAGVEVDCKYSFREGGWMLPPESWGHLIMVAIADDRASEWSVGVVRVRPIYLRDGRNRDGKSGLNPEGREAIRWIFRKAGFSPNVLLQLPRVQVDDLMAMSSGQQRVDELFRIAEGRKVHRNAIATVAQQSDYMKRVRYNGGSRSNLRPEGYLIIGGDYSSHRKIADEFGGPVPGPGEVVSFRVVAASSDDPIAVELDGGKWRRVEAGDASIGPAPLLPNL